MPNTSNPAGERTGSRRRTGARFPAAALVIPVTGVLLAGCSQGSGPAPTAPPSLTPSPTASTATQEEALASRIPLDGDRLRPLHWRLPENVPTDRADALLAARRWIALNQYVFSTARPKLWATTLAAVEKFTPDQFESERKDLIDLTWEERSSGPIWIWIMDVTEKNTDTVTVTACIDDAWAAQVDKQDDERSYGGVGVDVATVSRLGEHPDGQRWKLTRYEIYPDPEIRAKKNGRCEAWAATHTTTEGWTLPTAPVP